MERKHFLGFIAVLIFFLGISVYRTQRATQKETLDITLYDQLSTVQSSARFKERLTGLCIENGYVLEYRNASEITVNLLRQSPKTSVLILGMHSGVFEGKVWLFSGEIYSSSRHVVDQLSESVHIARCSSTSEVVFAIGEDFIEENWELEGCLVVLMGCDGMGSKSLADMIVEKGAAGVVRWSRPVSIDESDELTVKMIKLLMEGETLMEAVETVKVDVSLRYYPDEARGFVLK